jgi:quinoprotein glucose dehydrogenase
VWHYQAVHHDLFDYDFPCAPNLVTVRHEGRMRDGVAQVSKQGWIYLLDRETGKPLYPIEERAVAKSDVPGEESWPAQPYVTKPPAFSRLGVTEAETTSRERMKDVWVAPMFTPPKLDKEVLVFPGYHGGANWGGASWVADKGVMFINHNEIPWSLKLIRAAEGSAYPFEHTGYLRPEDENGYPAIRPPWGRLTAMDLHNTKILWQTPLGEYPELTAKGMKPTGTYIRGGNIATKGGLIFTGAAMDNQFRAFDQRTGEELWKQELAGGGWATPATYEADGRQFVVVATSPREQATGKGPRAGFTAFALPK